MRCHWLAIAAVAAMVPGCLAMSHLLPAPSEIFAIETWKTVPEGQSEVVGKVGDVFHLPLTPFNNRTELAWIKVSINDQLFQVPEYHISAHAAQYVFRAAAPGQYCVQAWREVSRRGYVAPPGTPDLVPLPREEDRSWPRHCSQITIVQ
jgi:hypothetical protein